MTILGTRQRVTANWVTKETLDPPVIWRERALIRDDKELTSALWDIEKLHGSKAACYLLLLVILTTCFFPLDDGRGGCRSASGIFETSRRISTTSF